MIEILFHCNSIHSYDIVLSSCTCHDSTAVVSCAKINYDWFIEIWMTAKWKFNQISTMVEKLFVKQAPVYTSYSGCHKHHCHAILPISYITTDQNNHSYITMMSYKRHAVESLAIWQFVQQLDQANIEEKIKASYHWPFERGMYWPCNVNISKISEKSNYFYFLGGTHHKTFWEKKRGGGGGGGGGGGDRK